MKTIPRLLRIGYAPTALLGANGLSLGLIGAGGAAFLPLLLLSMVALSFAAERARPYSAEWNRPLGDRLRDAIHGLVNEGTVFGSLLLLPAVAAHAPGAGWWPQGWPLVGELLLAILVLDAGITLAHWASHRWRPLWRFHAVHHSVRRMYGLNGLMKHPVHQAIESAAGTLPLVLCGLPADVGQALAFAVGVQLLLQHANVDYTVGPFRRWLATAEVHRFHHQKDPSLGNVNFGLFTTFWDRLLGTFHQEERERLRSEELGIAGDPGYPTRYLAQLAAPFVRPAPAEPAASRQR